MAILILLEQRGNRITYQQEKLVYCRGKLLDIILYETYPHLVLLLTILNSTYGPSNVVAIPHRIRNFFSRHIWSYH